MRARRVMLRKSGVLIAGPFSCYGEAAVDMVAFIVDVLKVLV